MNNDKLISWSDKGMAFSFFALIYFLPISIALSEMFTAFALFFYLVKRTGIFYHESKIRSSGGIKTSLLKKGYLFIKAYKPIPNCLNYPIAVFLIYHVLSVFLSEHPGVSFEGFLGKSLQSAFLYFNFIECINSRKRLKTFLTVLFVSCLLICVNGIYQYFSGHGFIHGHVANGRIPSSLRQANDFAAYLVVVIPVLLALCIMMFFGNKKDDAQNYKISFEKYFRKLTILSFVLLFMAIVCLFLTFSRGAWIAFFISILIFGFINRKLFIPFILIVVVFFSIFYPKLSQQRVQINDKKTFYEQNNRLGYWKRALDITKDYPIFGSGLNTYSLVSQRYTQGWGGYPHNSYLQLTSETGIVGISIFLWILTALFRCSYAAYQRIKIQSFRILLTGFVTGLFGFLLHSFFDTSFYSVQLGSLLWLTIGLVVSIQKIETANGFSDS